MTVKMTHRPEADQDQHLLRDSEPVSSQLSLTICSGFLFRGPVVELGVVCAHGGTGAP